MNRPGIKIESITVWQTSCIELRAFAALLLHQALYTSPEAAPARNENGGQNQKKIRRIFLEELIKNTVKCLCKSKKLHALIWSLFTIEREKKMQKEPADFKIIY